MYEVKSEAVRAAIEGSGCIYGVRLKRMDKMYGDADMIFTADSLISANSSAQSSGLSDDIELGAVCSAQWTITLYDVSAEYLGRVFELEIYVKDNENCRLTYGGAANFTYGALGEYTWEQIPTLLEVLDGEYIPMGVYTCTRCKRGITSSELTLSDALYFTDNEYVPSVTLPALASAIEDDICSQLGIVRSETETSGFLSDSGGSLLLDPNGNKLKTIDYDFTISEIPDKATMRDVLSYIASARGYFGYINRSGEYECRWYDNASVRTLLDSQIDYPTFSEQENEVVGVICTADGETLTSGETDSSKGRILSFENPFVTQELLDSIFNQIKGFKWHTADINMRLGDPRIDVGDTLDYYDENDKNYIIPATSLSFSYTGGMTAAISAYGLSVEETL